MDLAVHLLDNLCVVIRRLCERILEVCHCPSGSDDAMSYDVSAGNFTKQFVAFRFDDRGNRLVTLDSAKNGAAAAAAAKVNGEPGTRDGNGRRHFGHSA